MKIAKFVKEISVIDSDNESIVQLSIYKHENGGMFAIDSSYLEQTFDDEETPEIPDIFNENSNVRLED